MVGTSILGSWRSPIEKITIPNVKSRNRPPRNELKLSQSDKKKRHRPRSWTHPPDMRREITVRLFSYGYESKPWYPGDPK